LVEMVHRRRPGFDFENMNLRFDCSGGPDCLVLEYGGVKAGELGFAANFDYDEDMPGWAERNGKFRVYIANFHGRKGTRAPREIPIRPRAYDSSMRLGWKYKDNDAPEIDIFWVDSDDLLKPENVIYTLRGNDFDTNGAWWLNACNPIVIQKHESYITICASAHLTRTWAGELADRGRTRASCKRYIMSADEVARISGDDWAAYQTLAARQNAEWIAQRNLRLARESGALGGSLPHTLSRMQGLLR